MQPDRMEIRSSDLGWMGANVRAFEPSEELEKQLNDLLTKIVGKEVRGFILAAQHKDGVAISVTGLLTQTELAVMMMKLTNAITAHFKAARDKVKLVKGEIP